SAAWCRVQNHFFITRYKGGSNIAEALRVAHSQLTLAASNQPAQNFVMLFSNGITNCDLNRNCGNSEPAFNSAYTDVQNIVTTNYEPDEIALHMVEIGDIAGPHNLLVPSPVHQD